MEDVTENSVASARVDQTLFVVGVCFGLNAGDEAGAYDTSLRAQAKDRGQASAIRNATRS
jgi:hypothetical protein